MLRNAANDPDLYMNVKHMSKVRNPATALIVESLRTAAMDWPHSADYSGDGSKKGIPTEMRMTLLSPKERRRLYDDTTVTVVRLRSVPPVPGSAPFSLKDADEPEDEFDD